MRPEEGTTTRFARVDSVEVYELSDTERIAELCPEGVVYDLTVEDNHNYFANGILVHNCGAYPKPSKRFKDILSIQYSMVLLMSGTPSPESYSQLFHQYAIGNGPWRSFSNFYRWAGRYVNVKQKRVGTGQTVNDYSEARAGMVMSDIAPYVVRITQEEAGITTEIVEKVHLVPIAPRVRRLMRRLSRDRVIGNGENRTIIAGTGAALMSKLRQLAGGTVIHEGKRHGKGSTIIDRSKVLYIQRTFTGKTAILYTFDAEGRALREAYGTRATDSPEVFNADADRVFVGQVQASREGVNLSSADDLVFLGIDYAALSYIQARDRASYVGRDRENRVHWILSDGSLEPRILDIVRKKEDYTINHYRRDAGECFAGEDHQEGGG